MNGPIAPEMIAAAKNAFLTYPNLHDEKLADTIVAAVILAALQAAPDPWTPLHPDKPGYRAPTGADADEFGQVLYCTSFGKISTLSWRAVAEDVTFRDGKWMPTPPAPTPARSRGRVPCRKP